MGHGRHIHLSFMEIAVVLSETDKVSGAIKIKVCHDVTTTYKQRAGLTGY